jgi:hypothetical protein
MVNTKIEYEDLDKHFTAPKNHGYVRFFEHKRIPRKKKKKLKPYIDDFSFLDTGQIMWYVQGIENPNYNRFLIKKICEL